MRERERSYQIKWTKKLVSGVRTSETQLSNIQSYYEAHIFIVSSVKKRFAR